MKLNHFKHRIDVIFGNRLRHATAARVLITGEWSQNLRHPRALFVSFAGHNRSDCAAERSAFHAIVPVAVAHDERAKIRVTESKRAENM